MEMEPAKIANQMISFQKNLFESAFGAMSMVQEQTEKMVNTFFNQFPWIPEEGKKAITDSVKMYKEARDNFKKSVDDGFAKMEEMFGKK